MKLLVAALLFLTPLYSSAEDMQWMDTAFPPALTSAVSSFKQGKYRKTLTILKGIRRSGDKSAAGDKVAYLEGLAEAALGQKDKAAAAFRRSLTFRGSNSDVITHLGLLLQERGKPDEALAAFKEALWFDKFTHLRKEDVYYQIGLILQQQGKLSEAEENFRAALSANGTAAAPRVRLAEIMLKKGERGQALDLLRQARQKDPADREAPAMLASVLLTNVNPITGSQDIREALALTRALMQDKTVQEMAADKAAAVHIRALLANGELAEAEALLPGAAKAQPQNTELNRLVQQIDIEKQASALAAEGRAQTDPAAPGEKKKREKVSEVKKTAKSGSNTTNGAKKKRKQR